MDCPKCTGKLEPTSYNDEIHLHRCDACAGLWCKPEMVVHMKQEWMAEAAIDTGDPRIGKRLDRFDNIECPEGHGRMRKMVDEEQSHVWYEQCSTCDGLFLDAGELTDLKYVTLMDRLRALLKGPRR